MSTTPTTEITVSAIQLEVLTVLGNATKAERKDGLTAVEVATRCGLQNPTRAAGGVTTTLNRLVTATVAERIEGKTAWAVTAEGLKVIKAAEAKAAAKVKADAAKAAAKAAAAAAPAEATKA